MSKRSKHRKKKRKGKKGRKEITLEIVAEKG